MTEIFAVKPAGGHVVHLSAPGYQPGKKRRSVGDAVSLCNASVMRQARVPLAAAMQWPTPDSETELRPVWPWVWCRACIGHAVAIRGMERDVLTAIVENGGES